MRYRCSHCLWFENNNFLEGKCGAPVPQWVPMFFRQGAIGVKKDYANNCPLFKPKSDIEGLVDE